MGRPKKHRKVKVYKGLTRIVRMPFHIQINKHVLWFQIFLEDGIRKARMKNIHLKEWHYLDRTEEWIDSILVELRKQTPAMMFSLAWFPMLQELLEIEFDIHKHRTVSIREHLPWKWEEDIITDSITIVLRTNG